jgi:hypothetical protein
MAGGLYEIVPGVDLQPGDLIRARPTDEPDGIVGEQVADVYRLRPDLKVFRRVSDVDELDVLRRALAIATLNDPSPFSTVKRWIDQARLELAKERKS